MAQALESVAALLTAMGSSADRPDWPQKKALCLGKRGENMGKTWGKLWKTGKNWETMWETYGKNWENYRADLRNLWESLWEIMETYMGTICGIIWGKTGENSKNIRDNL